jgi:hypothetical protein
LATNRSVSDSIAILRRRFPGALICTTCARMIASTPTGYAPSKLTSDQVDNYVCSGCRLEADPARSREVTARFAASKAAALATRLRPPFIAIIPGTIRPDAPGTVSETIRVDDVCSCTATMTCHACLLIRAAEAAYGRRVAHDYLGICAMNGRHDDAGAVADCPNPTATIARCEVPSFCAHARPVENCVVHVSRRPQPAMPAKLARCKSCLGYHGKTGRDRCPYSAKEAEAVKASRAAAMKSAETPEVPTGSRKPSVRDSVKTQLNNVTGLPRIISHLANASKRLRGKPGRPATGTSRWARLRRRRSDEAA